MDTNVQHLYTCLWATEPCIQTYPHPVWIVERKGVSLIGFTLTQHESNSHLILLGCAVIFASKRNEAKRKRNFFRFDAKKKCFFRMFRIDVKRRNLKRNENGTKRKQNKKMKKSKKLPSFSLQSEMKRKGSKKLPSFSLRSEMKQKGSENCHHFRFEAK